MNATEITPQPAPPLKVGYVLRLFPRLSQSFVLNEIRALERLGHRVTILSLWEPGVEECALVPAARGRSVRYLEPTGPWVLARAIHWALRHHPLRLLRTMAVVAVERSSDLWITFGRALLVSRQADINHLEHLHAHLHRGTDVVWLVNQLTGRSYSFTGHARDIYVKTQYLARKMVAADFVITVCDYNRNLLAHNMPSEDMDKIHVIRPFLNYELFMPAKPTADSVIRRGPLRIATVCRLVPKKGVAVLLEALHLLEGRGVQVHATIVGEGREHERLEALSHRLGLSDIVAMPGAQDASGVRSLLDASDCFVLASVRALDGDSDATPTVLGEAMALGLPVVSTRIAGIPEIVPEDAGYLVESGDPQALADAIAAIAIMPPEERRVMGTRGRAFVRECWNGERDVHRLVTLFKRAITDHSNASRQRVCTNLD